jgi:hypothetical protein
MLTVVDLATLHLDSIAKARGYEHGAVFHNLRMDRLP